MSTIDVLIVGQGLAGSIMAHRCIERGLSVMVIDEDRPMTSSKIAAGLVNPITGRRFVISWMFRELNAVAQRFYRSMEHQFDCKLITPMPMIRAMEDRRFIDDVEAKTIDEFYSNYISSTTITSHDYFIPSPILYEVKNGYRVNIQQFIGHTKSLLIERASLLHEKFDFSALEINDQDVIYKTIKARRIIFCEGAQGRFNPHFNYLPFQPTKGELFELKHANVDTVGYKRDLILLPIEKDLLWCGALNFWEFTDGKPTDEGELILLQKLRKVYSHDPHIHRHLAAIRPTVRDRRPFLGSHPEHEHVHIFNGLGAKGTLLGPYFSEMLMAHIFDGQALMQEASIGRFK